MKIKGIPFVDVSEVCGGCINEEKDFDQSPCDECKIIPSEFKLKEE